MTKKRDAHFPECQTTERVSPPSDGKPRFGESRGFQAELRRRVEEFLDRTGRKMHDCPQLYVKAAIVFAVFAACYVFLVFVARAWWQALPLAILLGLATGAIGFNIQHDGSHQAFSGHPWVNKLMAMSLDLIGGSSYLWYWKHVASHHTYVNITGHDADVDLGVLGRLTPHQKRYAFHRWQHLYLWPAYGFMAIRWQLYGDFRDIVAGRIGECRIPRPTGRKLIIFLAGKAAFLALAFGVPLLMHPWWVVLAFYGVTAVVVGIVLSVVFQLAHCVEEAEFPMPRPDTGRMENDWCIHQVETTVDFARRSRVAAWLLGGLNYQVEHHLFPRICHVNYPAISQVVEATCRDFGVKYLEHKSLWSGLASHYRWLRRMGLRDSSG
ncbi:MAG TPA: acyl-CoA desaturase [Opitutaceae bacterium]|nr:acyl-CoA desaturase [Opitutaceae bacterium]